MGADGSGRRATSGRHGAAAATIGLGPGAEDEAAGQDARKYETTNPLVQKLLERWLASVADACGPSVVRLLDVGIGEGFALARLGRREATQVGIEFRFDKLHAARDRVAVGAVRGDAGMLPFPGDSFDLVLCTEVLEHLVRPADAVRELARVTRGRCVVSVPWEPWFRLGNAARGKNLGRFGNDPEHVGWYSPRRLARELEPWFGAVSVRRCLPWLIAVAEPVGHGNVGN